MSNDTNMDNMVLANFMAKKKQGPLFITNTNGEAEFNRTYLNDMKFHKSYDWLMPVWEKFRELEMPKMESALDDYNIWLAKVRHIDKICIAMTRGAITDLYNALVNAVKWYNEVTKQKQ